MNGVSVHRGVHGWDGRRGEDGGSDEDDSSDYDEVMTKLRIVVHVKVKGTNI